MSEENNVTPPNSEIARVIVYLAGFTLGVCAVAASIFVLFTQPDLHAVAYAVLALGLALMGQGGIATAFVPSVRGNHGK